MVRASGLTRWLWPLAAALLFGAGWEWLRVRDAQHFNAALRANDLAVAGAFVHARGAFAAALAAQRRGELERARQGYSSVLRRDADLRPAARFNLANSYLRRALELADTGDEDVVGPLIELAKEEYREVLRADPAAWDAKYNLELALSVQPDVEDIASAAEAMPEHSRHAIATQRKLERLP